MDTELKKAFEDHIIWFESDEKLGKQLVLKDKQYSKLSINNIALLDVGMLDCEFSNSAFEKIDFSYGNFGYTKFIQSKLEKNDFIKADMDYLKVIGTEVSKCNFFRASLMHVEFIDSHFYDTNLSNTHLLDADISNSIFENVNFSDSRLKNVNFSMATIRNCCCVGTKFIGAKNLDKAKIESIIIEDDVILYAEEARTWIQHQVTN